MVASFFWILFLFSLFSLFVFYKGYPRFHCVLIYLYQISWGRRVTSIHCYCSLIYSRVTFKPIQKYLGEKILDPQNINEKKFRTYKIPTRKNFGPKKFPREKNFDPWHKQEKKFGTHEIPTRKKYGPTKARWHDGTRLTAHSFMFYWK